MQLKKVSINCIVELLELGLKKPSFLYHYNLILQDETFCIAYWLFYLYFTYKTGLKKTNASMFIKIILQIL